MIDFTMLPLFITATFLLAISPGPDLVLISTYSSTKGFKSGLMVSLGVLVAGVFQTLLVAIGLGQLMQSMPVLAYGIKIIGAIYLSYLGLNMLLKWYCNKQQKSIVKSTEDVAYLDLVYKGILNNLLNPKALLFFSLFLPQFTTGADALFGQILVLGLILSTFVFVINTILSFVFSKLGKLVGSKLNLGKHIDAFLGVMFLGLAARLATNE